MKGNRISLFAVLILGLLMPVLQAQDVVIESISSTPVTCGNGSDGSITVEVSGGIGDYTYTLYLESFIVGVFGPTPNTTHTFTDQTRSNGYIVLVTDEDGDTQNGFSFASVGGALPISIDTYSGTDITCNNANNGVITVSASGEDGNLLYTLNPGGTQNSSGVFTGLSQGDYTVTVSHATCPSTDVTPVITINNPTPVTVTVNSIDDVSCYGDNDGSISISPSGGTPGGSPTGYTYSWSGPGGFTSTEEDITFLAAGDYSVIVTDGNGCTANGGPYTVSEPPELTASLISTTDVTCPGGNDGKASIDRGGGTGGYSYSWDGQTTGMISTERNPDNLPADTYDLTLFDNSGCSKTFTDFAIISEPDPLDAALVSTSDVSCNSGSDGSADISPSGGTAPYTFLWTGASTPYTSTDEDPSGMPADSYSLLLTDNRGCNSTFNNLLTIGEPAPISIGIDGSTPVSCPGGNDGTAMVTVSGGTPGFSLVWTGNVSGHVSNDEDPLDLVADTYSVDVIDGNTCTASFPDLLTISEPAEIAVIVDNVVDVNCNGESTGSIEITASGGNAPLSFDWTGPNGFTSTDEDPALLEAGVYNLTITDAKACMKEFLAVATVNTSTSITATFVVTDISCNGLSDGAINASVSGGQPGYNFSWTGPGGFTDNIEDIAGLPGGDYTLSVTDALGCTEVFPAQTVNEPAAITATATKTDIDCFGADDGSIDLTPGGGVGPYTFVWTGPGGFTSTDEDISNLEPGSYDVSITDSNGCTTPFPAIAIINENPVITATAVASNISCNGAGDGSIDLSPGGGVGPYTFAWTGPGGFTSSDEDISMLEAGTYNLSITDALGCSLDFPGIASISEPPAISASLVSSTDLLCNGDAGGSAEIDVNGGTPPLVFKWTDAGGGTVSIDEDPAGLQAGTYSLQITDASGCIASYPDILILTEPPILEADLNSTNILCYGNNNGSISVVASGGTPAYEYSRLGDIDVSYQPNPNFTGLGQGFYTIWTRDANGCVTSDTVTITEPEEIQILGETKSGQNLCWGDSSASITIDDVTGGVKPYEYSIDGGTNFQTSNEFHNLPAGSYQTVVRDASSCMAFGNLNVITQPSQLFIDSYYQEDITTCSGAAEGRIVIAGGGGFGTKNYTLDGSITNSSGDFQDLKAGTHLVSISDQNGCSLDTTVEILAPPALVIDVLNLTHVSGCSGDVNGEISGNAAGGSGALRHSIDGGPYQPGGAFSFTGLAAGPHTISILDANDCPLDTVVILTEPEPMIITAETVTPIICAGTSDGSIEISVSGGSLPLTYTLSPGAQSNETGLFIMLGPGSYSVSIDDSEGCGPITSSVLDLSDPPELFLDSVTREDISCFGSADGSLAVHASGGNPPYEYSHDNGNTWQSDSLFSDLGPGDYDIYLRDANLCTKMGGRFTLADPPELLLSVTATDIAGCAGDTTGILSLSGSGGTGILEYSLDDITYQASGLFEDLAAGDYTIWMRDANGCQVSEPATITEPDSVSATITITDALFGNKGSITIGEAAGGIPPYEYSIEGTGGNFSGQTEYTGLDAGTYEVVVRDANGCTYEKTVEVLDIIPLEMDLNLAHVSCFGADDGSIEFVPIDAEGAVTYSIDSGQNFLSTALFENLAGDSTYHLVAIDEAGKVFVGSATIIEPMPISVDPSISLAECNVFSPTGAIAINTSGGTGILSFSWSDGSTEEDRTDLESGVYFLETSDENGCMRTDTMEVSSWVIVDAYAGEDTTICYGGSVQLHAEGGNTPAWTPVDFLDDPDIADPVAAGITETTTYILTITEETSSYGCFNIDSITIDVHPMTGISAGLDTFVVRGQSVQLEALGGPFTDYRWEPETGLDNAYIPDPLATPGQTTVYHVYALNEHGCEESDSLLVEVIDDIRAYNVFTPGGDGINDFFEIKNAERFPEIVVEVYSRWGDLLYSAKGYDEGNLWDGYARGKRVPTGTYYYVIIPYSGAKPITGNVTVIWSDE